MEGEENVQVCAQHAITFFWWPRITSVYFGAGGPAKRVLEVEETKGLATSEIAGVYLVRLP